MTDVDPGRVAELARPLFVFRSRSDVPCELVGIRCLELRGQHPGSRARRLCTGYCALEHDDIANATTRELESARAAHHASTNDDDAHQIALSTPPLTRMRGPGLLGPARREAVIRRAKGKRA